MEIVDYLEQIENEKYKDSLLELYSNIESRLKSFPAAIRWHHSESGGLYRHIKEVLEIIIELYECFKGELLKIDISKDDVILVAFVHDLEKLDKYVKNNSYNPQKKYEKGYKETEFSYNYKKIDMNDTAQIVRICAQYGIILSNMHINAISFHHGGWSADRGRLQPLAALLHAADLISATFFKNE
jgi:hypothetical protein